MLTKFAALFYKAQVVLTPNKSCACFELIQKNTPAHPNCPWPVDFKMILLL